MICSGDMWIVVMLALDSFDVIVLDGWWIQMIRGISKGVYGMRGWCRVRDGY